MIVFCPNCGTQNPGLPGARATCGACGSAFDVPGEAAGKPPAPAPAKAPGAAPRPQPPPATFGAPGAQIFSPLPAAGLTPGAPQTNSLAIVALVAGIVCCIPFFSPAVALGCGLAALKQIDASPTTQAGRSLAIAGIILGSLAALSQLSGLISLLQRGHW